MPAVVRRVAQQQVCEDEHLGSVCYGGAHTHAAATTRTAKCNHSNSDAKLPQLRRRGAARFRRRALHQPRAHSPAAAVALAVAPGRRRIKAVVPYHTHGCDLIHPLQADGAASTKKCDCTKKRVSCARRGTGSIGGGGTAALRVGAPKIIQPMTNGGSLPSLPASAPDPARACASQHRTASSTTRAGHGQ